MYKEADTGTIWTVDAGTAQVADSPAGVARCWVTTANGLYVGGTNIHWADSDIIGGGTAPGSNTICEFEGRIWLNLANILRGSDLTNPALETTWRGPVDPVNGTMTLANALIMVKMQQLIKYLLVMNGALYIFCEDGVYTLSTFFNGAMRKVYSGAALPKVSADAPFRIYTNGQIAYYVNDNKFYAFTGSIPQLISDRLNLSQTLSWFTGEYDNRVWFLVNTAAFSTGAEANLLYAIDLTTGAWEKYDIQMTTVAAPNIDTPTAIMGGEDKVATLRGDRLWIGTTKGKVWYLSPTATGTPLAWSFTTKTYVPSFDAYSRFVHFKIRYVGQAASSPVTIKQYVCRDGITGSADTIVTRATTTLDMVGTGGGLFQKDIECHAEIGEGVYFTVSGSGTATICDVGVEFVTRSAGDVNA
jgi:hypothetical protein